MLVACFACVCQPGWWGIALIDRQVVLLLMIGIAIANHWTPCIAVCSNSIVQHCWSAIIWIKTKHQKICAWPVANQSWLLHSAENDKGCQQYHIVLQVLPSTLHYMFCAYSWICNVCLDSCLAQCLVLIRRLDSCCILWQVICHVCLDSCLAQCLVLIRRLDS